jgi:hypothetical protein
MVTGEMTSGAPFILKGSECTKTLAPETSCKIEVEFEAPMNTTAQSGTLTVTSSASGSPQSIPIMGTAKASKK